MTSDRFKLAREIHGWTQMELAKRILETSGRTVGQSTIAEIETGRLMPSSDLISAISLASDFPVEFYEQAELDDFPIGTLIMYRSKAQTSAREEAMVRR